jgi:hypothetical protein
MKTTKNKLRKIIREQVQSWAEREAEMDAWDQKLVAVLPPDPEGRDLDQKEIEAIAKLYIDEHGDSADLALDDDRGSLKKLGVLSSLRNIFNAISDMQDQMRSSRVDASPNKNELAALGKAGVLEDRDLEYITYQPRRKGGNIAFIQIEDNEAPWGMPLGNSTFMIDDRDARSNGTSIDKILSVLEQGGATLRKKGKSVKHVSPYYD